MPLKIEIPVALKCPITKTIIIDPVITGDGHSYEREAITQYMAQNNNATPNSAGSSVQLVFIPNQLLKTQTQTFVQTNKPQFEQELLDAAQIGDLETLKLVLGLGIDVATKDAEGWTGLHHAAFNNYPNMISIFLQYQLPVDINTAVLTVSKDLQAEAFYQKNLDRLEAQKKEFEHKKGLLNVLEDFKRYDAAVTMRKDMPTSEFLTLTAGPDRSQFDKLSTNLGLAASQQASCDSQYDKARSASSTYDYSSDRNGIYVKQDTVRALAEGLKVTTEKKAWAHQCLKQAQTQLTQFKNEQFLLNPCLENIRVNILAKFNNLNPILFSSQTISNFDQCRKLTLQETQKYDLVGLDIPAIDFQLHKIQEQLAQLKDSAKHQANTQKVMSCTPFLLAAYRGHIDILKTLISAKANMTAKDSLQRTALHWAANNGHTELLQLLLEHDASNVNQPDSQGNTALHLAVQFLTVHTADTWILLLLCNHGANVSLVNQDFKNAIDLAKDARRLDMMNMLTQQLGRIHRPKMRSMTTQTEASNDARSNSPAFLMPFESK